MDRKEINQLLENIEEHVMQILETADFAHPLFQDDI